MCVCVCACVCVCERERVSVLHHCQTAFNLVRCMYSTYNNYTYVMISTHFQFGFSSPNLDTPVMAASTPMWTLTSPSTTENNRLGETEVLGSVYVVGVVLP